MLKSPNLEITMGNRDKNDRKKLRPGLKTLVDLHVVNMSVYICLCVFISIV